MKFCSIDRVKVESSKVEDGRYVALMADQLPALELLLDRYTSRQPWDYFANWLILSHRSQDKTYLYLTWTDLTDILKQTGQIVRFEGK